MSQHRHDEYNASEYEWIARIRLKDQRRKDSSRQNSEQQSGTRVKP